MQSIPFQLIQKTPLETWRAETFYEKEPETVAWIKDFMQDGEVFYDVGANVGVYSLYASCLYPKMQIFSFEPMVENFYRLQENIILNQANNIIPVCMACGKKSGPETFYCNNQMAGASGGQIERPVNEAGKTFEPEKTYSISVIRIDDFIRSFESPHHIKIDVDGHEIDILQGMEAVLSSSRLKSVLIEVNRNMVHVKKIFNFFGFTASNRFNSMENHSRVRRVKTGIRAENLIFTRE